MIFTNKQNAHAVIFPAFSCLSLSDSVKEFLSEGGCSILVGETREEYVSRQVSIERKLLETPETVLCFNNEAKSFSKQIIIAVDQEISGICRLHDLVEPFPSIEELQTIHLSDFEHLSSKIATAAKKLGFNCFLGPILDIVSGINPWLLGRTWTTDPIRLSDISSAFIRGIQSSHVAAAAKHFPGYSTIELDPAIESEAIMDGSLESIQAGYIPFEDAIKNNVEIIMTGPAIIETLDPNLPASLSPKIIQTLKSELGFKGLILSDDLDSKATLRNKTISSVAIDALNAGSDLLLVADTGSQIQDVVSSIIQAVNSGTLSERRLYEAAEKVRIVAAKYST